MCYNRPVEEEYISVQEAASRKNVAATTIYEAVKRGEIPAHRFMGRVALKPSDVDAFQPGSYGGVERTRKKRGPIKKVKQEPSK